MNTITNVEMILIKESIEIYNDENEETIVFSIPVVHNKLSCTRIISLMCLIVMVGLSFTSCTSEIDSKSDKTFTDNASEYQDPNSTGSQSGVQKPFISEQFKIDMDNHFSNEVLITMKNIGSPYDEIEMRLEIRSYDVVMASIGEDVCLLMGEPNVDGHVDFDNGDCSNIKLYFDAGVFESQGITIGQDYYEVISQ